MSLTQDHGDHVFECDGKGCHATLDTRTSNFDSARNALRRAKWKTKPRVNQTRPVHEAGEWDHFCPDCQGELL